MNVESFFYNLTSEQPEQLFVFYRDVVGLPVAPEFGEHALQVGGAHMGIDGHSETKGQTREPHRVLINFFVEDIAAEEARLQAAGVPVIRSQGKEYWGGIISTFTDPDGNYFQCIEYRPEAA